MERKERSLIVIDLLDLMVESVDLLTNFWSTDVALCHAVHPRAHVVRIDEESVDVLRRKRALVPLAQLAKRNAFPITFGTRTIGPAHAEYSVILVEKQVEPHHGIRDRLTFVLVLPTCKYVKLRCHARIDDRHVKV